jgi:hypothetical protein
MLDSQDMVSKVQNYLNKNALASELMLQAVEAEELVDCWHVMVQPEVWPRRSTPFFELLIELEDLIFDEEDVRVQLIPKYPE